MAEWISVKERLPEDSVPVLAFDGTKHEEYGCRMAVSNYLRSPHKGRLLGMWALPAGTGIAEVTHWMPLPKPPKETS